MPYLRYEDVQDWGGLGRHFNLKRSAKGWISRSNRESSLSFLFGGHFSSFRDLSYTLDTTSHNQLKTTTKEGWDDTCPILAGAPTGGVGGTFKPLGETSKTRWHPSFPWQSPPSFARTVRTVRHIGSCPHSCTKSLFSSIVFLEWGPSSYLTGSPSV